MDSLEAALKQLIKKEIVVDNKLALAKVSNVFDYLDDLICYGLTRYEIEYGDFEGDYKLYSNYSKEQAVLIQNIDFTMDIQLKGTYISKTSGDAFLFVGLKKDKTKQERTNYKDLFLSPKVFQWESENNTTRDNAVGRKLLAAKKAYLFVRKVDEEDGINSPFTYFGTGTLTNVRDSIVVNTKTGAENKTLLFDVVLDNEVPAEYRVDFEVPDIGLLS